LPTDTRHVLKFRNDPFRGINGGDSKKTTFAKQMPSSMAVAAWAAAKNNFILRATMVSER